MATLMHESLTVLIQTSPIPSHPSTALLEALFRSFAKADGLLESRIVILADGCEELAIPADGGGQGNGSNNSKDEVENIKHGKCHSKTAQNYRSHLIKLEQIIRDQIPPFRPIGGGSVELVQLERRHGSAPAIQAAIERIVSTPLVMICQHDNFFVNEAPLREVVGGLLEEPRGLGIGANCIHFLSTATLNYREKVKRRYKLELGEPISVESLKDPLVPLIFWYGRSHVTYTDYVRSHCLNRELAPGSHLEELLGEKQLHHIIKHGMGTHRDFGTYVLDQGKEVLYHMSGRRVRAADENDAKEEDAHTSTQNQETTSDLAPALTTHGTKQEPYKGSFTTARETRAKVPGLAFLSTEDDQKDEKNKTKPMKRKPFKQRCFFCGEKGHSKKFCPAREQAFRCKPASEIIEL
mmetsp:Transcript_29999/g.62724  ORF Transcript_29999/g.62724 Transcript_29999/m.62724 type:complete len:409 (-) Transcript_29999:2171-3397(-)